MTNHKYPVRFVKKIENMTLDKYVKLKDNYYIIAKVNFYLDERVTFIVKRIKNKLFAIKSGVLVLHEPEIDYLIKHNAYIDIKYAYLYKYSYNVFDSYINYWYEIKKNNEGAKRFIAKIYLNSLYGKFGQHRRYTEYILKENPEFLERPRRIIIDENGKKKVLSDYGLFMTETGNETISYSPEISGSITAYARMKLAEYVEVAGIDNVVYCDTDSIHTTNRKLDAYIGKEIGLLKIEKEGSAEYLAPKVYQINNEWTFKGININKDEKIAENKWITHQFSRIKTVYNEAVIVKYVVKNLSFLNDKFKYVNDIAYSMREDEIYES